ncbi:MAG: hypothetical protein HFI54_00725 [Lachnospiraceae bacterium]|nr:hypothetical protein [Lachnospiraceae bacterium]
MNKKILLKITVSILACMSFALISNHMPNLMQAVYQAIFGEFDHIALPFVLGLFIFEIIVLRYLGKDIRCWYFCLGTVIIAAFLVLFAGDTNYTDKLSPGANTTLLYSVLVDGNAEELGREKVFAEYYFDGKNLIVSEQEKDNEKHRYLYTMAVPARRVVVGQESVISEDAAKMILSYPFRDFDSDYFVIDEFWEHTRNIKMAEWGDRYIFCSEELFDAVLNHSNDIVLSGEGIDLFAYAENGSFREVKQTFIILILLMIGAAIVLPLWGRDYPYLALFLSLPVGAAVWCIACVALMIFNIPYNILTVTVCVVLGVGIRLFRQWNKLKELDRAICFQFILLAFVVTYFFACFKICNIYSDSATRCTYAYHMAIFGSMRDVLEYIAPFGMLEPTIMSMGYLFRCDAVYVFYPLMAICDIGIMCAGFYYINNKKCNYMAIAALGTGILLLITNFDFVYSAVVMAVHGPTAVYFLIFFVIILMKKKINIARFEWLVVIAATVILLTRIEGAVYVMFFLALTLGMEDSSLKMNRIILAVAGILIVWNVFQMIVIGNDGDPTFWTPQRGMLLIAGALLVVVASWFFSKPWSWLDYLKRHYFLILVSGVCLATIFTVIFVKRDIGSANLPFYLSHFSNNERMNDRINAGAIWTFILLLCPIVIKNGKSTEKYIVSMILGYIVLIYFICLFRAEVWLHYGYYDSGRKTLVQIMPAAIWLLACSVGDKENLIKKKNEEWC